MSTPSDRRRPIQLPLGGDQVEVSAECLGWRYAIIHGPGRSWYAAEVEEGVEDVLGNLVIFASHPKRSEVAISIIRRAESRLAAGMDPVRVAFAFRALRAAVGAPPPE